MTDYYCPFTTAWRCPDKDIPGGDKPCQLKHGPLGDDYTIAEYIASWDCPIAIKEGQDDIHAQ